MALIRASQGGGGGKAPKMDRFTASLSSFNLTYSDFVPKEAILSTRTTTGYFAVLKLDIENSVIYQSLNGANFTPVSDFNDVFYCSNDIIYYKALNSYWAVPTCIIVSDQHFDT